MKAGRELDALVAEKVMGLGPQSKIQDILPYSTDIAAAWKVVERAALRRSTELSNVMNGWLFEIYNADDESAPVCEGFGPSAPLAICLAAVEAAAQVSRKKPF